MQKLILLFLVYSVSSFSMEKRSCYEDFQNYDPTTRTSRNVKKASGVFTIGFSIAASPLAFIPLAVLLTTNGIEEVKDIKVNRLMRLIEDSEAKIANPEAETGRRLAKTVRKLNRRLEVKIDELSFAKAIDQANKERSLCSDQNIISIATMKRNARKNGDPLINDEEANLKQELEGAASSDLSSENSVAQAQVN